jgi:8-oxo-dGTP pyrophosphatase MutT (NUDIX family)
MKRLAEADIARLLALAYRPETLAESEHQVAAYATVWQRAAVLLPLIRQRREWHLLFIRRADRLAHHQGEVAFPGGACQPTETPEQTALREAEEEIGLPAPEVRLLGRLQDIVTSTAYRVTPVVGVIPWPYPVRLSPAEVARIFTVPLPWLARRGNWHTTPYDPGDGRDPFEVVVYRPYEGEVLWGASARIVHNFLLALGWLPAERASGEKTANGDQPLRPA